MSKPCRPRKLVTHFRVCEVYGGSVAKSKGLLVSLWNSLICSGILAKNLTDQHKMSKDVPYYFRHLNTRLFDSLPAGMERVLEFGCSAGMLGKAYKEKNPDTVWHGVEINQDAADRAQENLDAAWVLNANDLQPNETMLATPYDAIIYGDVIEHLIDPAQSMPKNLELLKHGGELIACIPNVQHWTVVKDLLQGNWAYRNAGLMDNTHLRFFTRKSIHKLLKKLGLKLVEHSGFRMKIKHLRKELLRKMKF